MLLSKFEIVRSHLLFTISLFFLSLTPLYSFLLFHTISEFYSIIIAGTIFVIVYNLKDKIEQGYLTFLAISYLYVGVIDFFHTLAYKGMNIFIGFDTNLPTQLWISARYMESVSFFLALHFINKKINFNKIQLIYFFVTIFLFLFIFVFKIFPDCYIEGLGLTPFKIYSEYLICLILFFSLLKIRTKRSEFPINTFNYVQFGIITTILAEFSFTKYIGVYGFFNFLGHIFKIVSFYCIYRAIIITALKEPFSLLWLKLKEAFIKLNTYVELLDLVFVVIDRDKNIVLINENGANKLGYMKEELIGKNWIELLIPDDEKEKYNQIFDDIIAEKAEAVQVIEYNIFKKDKTKRVFAWHNTALKDAENNIVGIVCAGEDITDKKLYDENREKLIKELEESLKKIRRLEGLIPICAECKKVRTDEGYWVMVESYLKEISGMEITHGMCPNCYEKYKREIEHLKKDLK